MNRIYTAALVVMGLTAALAHADVVAAEYQNCPDGRCRAQVFPNARNAAAAVVKAPVTVLGAAVNRDSEARCAVQFNCQQRQCERQCYGGPVRRFISRR